MDNLFNVKKNEGYSIKCFLPPARVELQELLNLYNSVLPINKEKKENLLDMCKFIPLKYREFYNNLLSAD